eukprot:3496867-Pyramimonas_sp.AAC.1
MAAPAPSRGGHVSRVGLQVRVRQVPHPREALKPLKINIAVTLKYKTTSSGSRHGNRMRAVAASAATKKRGANQYPGRSRRPIRPTWTRTLMPAVRCPHPHVPAVGWSIHGAHIRARTSSSHTPNFNPNECTFAFRSGRP